MIYSPFDFLNTSEVWLPPLIIFLHIPFNVKVSLFSKVTVLFFLTLIAAHSPVVDKGSSKSFNVDFCKVTILTFSNPLLTIIGAVVFEVKSKFCKYKLTELDLITMFASSDFPWAK
jgi:hypothetical protein